MLSADQIHALVDLTLLRPGSTAADFRALCETAVERRCFSVCVPSRWVGFARATLGDAEPVVCCTIGFPHGNVSTAAKAAEARQAVLDGAAELDMVVSLGALMDGDLDAVRADIAAVVDAADGAAVKVILETAALDDEQKRAGARAAEQAGASFVKTSTGFGPGGATVADVTLLRASVGPAVQVKASGGIRDLAAGRAMIDAGAARIGTSRPLGAAEGGADGY